MITIEAKPFEVKASLPGYGIFYLRRLGASRGAELREKLDVAQKMIDDATHKYQDIIDKESELKTTKNQQGLIKLRATTRYKEAEEAQKEASQKLQEALDFSDKCQLGLWRSEKPEAMKRLLDDFTIKEIRGFYAQVMEESHNA